MGSIPGYRIKAKLGKGGMATVYLAVQLSFERDVALKVMSTSLAADPGFAKRFIREAKTNARLNHRHIVAVYDVGKHEQFHYLAMELLNGNSLKDRLKSGPLEPEEALRITRELAQALDYAASEQIIHRDIKPDNIMFRHDESTVLMDFGIARTLETDEQITRMGMVVGTPRYMSPEQHRGDPLDHRSDLYSLGCVFFEMLTGEPPYKGTNDPMAIGLAHVRDPIPLLPKSLRHYQPVLKKLLAKTADQRYDSSEALINALTDIKQPAASTEAQFDTGSKTHRIAEKQSAASVTSTSLKLEPVMRSKEVSLGGLLRKRYAWKVFIIADDFNQFQSYFDRFSQELFQWREQRGKKTAEIHFKATLHPWIAGRVKEYLRKLRQSDSHTFMQDIPLLVTLVGADGEPIERYQLKTGEKNESPLSTESTDSEEVVSREQ